MIMVTCVVHVQASGVEKPEPEADFCHEGGENAKREDRLGERARRGILGRREGLRNDAPGRTYTCN